MTVMNVLQWREAAADTLKHGGGTYSPSGAAFIGTLGYMVGGSVPSVTIQIPGTLTKENAAAYLAERISMFTARNAYQLSLRNSGWVGTTMDSPTSVTLDISEWVAEPERAMALAVYRGEQYIYDIKGKKTIPVERGVAGLLIAMEEGWL